MQEPKVRVSRLVFGEQLRWHENRLWFSDWGTQEVIALDLEGHSEIVFRGPSHGHSRRLLEVATSAVLIALGLRLATERR